MAIFNLPFSIFFSINSRLRVGGIDPAHFLRRLCRGDIEIHDDRFLVAADHDARYWLVTLGIDFLMRNKRRHKYEITGAGVGDKLQLFTPAHSSLPADYVDDAFQFTVMMGSRFRAGLDAQPGAWVAAMRDGKIPGRRPLRTARRLLKP